MKWGIPKWGRWIWNRLFVEVQQWLNIFCITLSNCSKTFDFMKMTNTLKSSQLSLNQGSKTCGPTMEVEWWWAIAQANHLALVYLALFKMAVLLVWVDLHILLIIYPMTCCVSSLSSHSSSQWRLDSQRPEMKCPVSTVPWIISSTKPPGAGH